MQTKLKKYDVVICGAGLAGLTLARQLLMQLPNLKLLLIDRLKRPLPHAGFKVGESTVHPGGTYLCNVLQLREYLDINHIEKYGLRYFFGSHKLDFSSRAESGRSVYDAAINEHQIDRGIFENDMRQMVVDGGAELLEGAVLKDIELSKLEDDHVVHFKCNNSNNLQQVKARWVVDATGRRQFLSRKLGLRQEFESNCSATWLHVKGRFDVSDFVPADNRDWHERVSREHPFLSRDRFSRYNSTNHIMGYGYWIWVIPLVSGSTSVGIVTHNDYHSFSSRNTLDKTMWWLSQHDPLVADRLQECEVLDFKAIANYAYTSKQVYSIDRWACTGESAVFSDPFQSPGTDAIAIANCYIKELIHSDLESKLTPKLVESINREFIDYSRTLTEMIQSSYPTFYNETIGTISVMWYLAWAMSFVVPNMRFRIYKDGYITSYGAISKEEYKTIEEINQLGLLTSRFIRDWGIEKKQRPDRDGYQWMNLWHVPFFSEYRTRMLTQGSPQWAGNLKKLKHFAAAIFLVATEEIHPETFQKLPAQFVPNVNVLSINPSHWINDGLYDSDSDIDWESCMLIYSDLKKAFYSKTMVSQT
ncbi:MAG: NAD(P)/FAD-dependent oxidoreductase [Prochloraceae cyanobacterium]|nr:NAD(P)/FAD-dependent oxidoreductase [Prochloraceae cyanobacterium]